MEDCMGEQVNSFLQELQVALLQTKCVNLTRILLECLGRYMPMKIRQYPSSWEEAMADLDSSESDILNGRGTSWTIVKQMMSDRIMSYSK